MDQPVFNQVAKRHICSVQQASGESDEQCLTIQGSSSSCANHDMTMTWASPLARQQHMQLQYGPGRHGCWSVADAAKL